jgi:acetyl-CoA synthetase
MDHEIIRKRPRGEGEPRLPTGWGAARARLDGLPGGGRNIAHEALERHVAAGHGADLALIWLGREGARRTLTYADLAAEAARFAHVLHAHGIAPGERMFILSGRVPELYAATLGAMKAGVVVSPLFAAFGPEPVRARMESATRGSSSPPRSTTRGRSRRGGPGCRA